MTEQLCRECDQIVSCLLAASQAMVHKMAEKLCGKCNQAVEITNICCNERKSNTSSNSGKQSREMEFDEDWIVKMSRLLDSKLIPVMAQLDEIRAKVQDHAQTLAPLTEPFKKLELKVNGASDVSGSGVRCEKPNMDQLEACREAQLKLSSDRPAPCAPEFNSEAKKTEFQRQTIWRGVLEWNDKRAKGAAQAVKSVPCAVTSNAKDGEPEVKVENWPPKLVMQLLPKALISNIGGVYLKNSTSVLFHPSPCPALDALTKVMSSNIAGCVQFNNSNSPDCNLKMLILLYTPDKKVYLGFIPNDQTAFIERLRLVIQQSKNKSIMRNVFGDPQGSSMARLQSSVRSDDVRVQSEQMGEGMMPVSDMKSHNVSTNGPLDLSGNTSRHLSPSFNNSSTPRERREKRRILRTLKLQTNASQLAQDFPDRTRESIDQHSDTMLSSSASFDPAVAEFEQEEAEKLAFPKSQIEDDFELI
ncbi:mediator of RNA polymerase II transcription subunit 25-like [Planococcus citri]|uniref:mediator of RNA polymerase II transcription subunit 25-like n=1 Tax=Planococcus citri TaxID=170843 RepID=UPI0031F75476